MLNCSKYRTVFNCGTVVMDYVVMDYVVYLATCCVKQSKQAKTVDRYIVQTLADIIQIRY